MAQLTVGLSYSEGKGVLKDEIEALAWFNISAISGYETARSFRGIFERRLGPQVVLVAQQRSKEI